MKRTSRITLLLILLCCTATPAAAQMSRRALDRIENHLNPEPQSADTTETRRLTPKALLQRWQKRRSAATVLEQAVEEMERESADTVRHASETLRVDTLLLQRLQEEYMRLYEADSLTRRINDIAALNALAVPPGTYSQVEWFTVGHTVATAKILSRFARYKEQFRRVFRSYGIPEDLTALCIVESAVNPRAVSPAGAVGMWQFMPETASACGLVVNAFRDDRTDPMRSCVAAAAFLGTLYDRFGSWSLAVSAYNCGAGRVEAAAARAGTFDYDRLRDFLPEETRQYLPRLLGAIYAVKYFSHE